MTARKKEARVIDEQMIPSDDLARIVGAAPKSRAQIAKSMWDCIILGEVRCIETTATGEPRSRLRLRVRRNAPITEPSDRWR